MVDYMKKLKENLLKRIERLKGFEERLDVHFEKLSIRLDDSGFIFWI